MLRAEMYLYIELKDFFFDAELEMMIIYRIGQEVGID